MRSLCIPELQILYSMSPAQSRTKSGRVRGEHQILVQEQLFNRFSRLPLQSEQCKRRRKKERRGTGFADNVPDFEHNAAGLALPVAAEIPGNTPFHRFDLHSLTLRAAQPLLVRAAQSSQSAAV